MDNGVYRVMDVNLNRLNEAIRVLEDGQRLISHCEKSASFFKHVRHELAELFLPFQSHLLVSRKTEDDIGREISGKMEYKRSRLSDIWSSNFKRAEQSLRVLEEYSKLLNVDLSKKIEVLRYEMYEVEQQMMLMKEFPSPCLYVLVTKSLCKGSPEEVVRKVAASGADVIQLREKDLEDRAFLKWVEEVLRLVAPYGTSVIVNDKIQYAKLVDIAGVHLGQGDLGHTEARSLLSSHQWLGRSTHCIEEARQAKEEGVDYIGVGPLFPTQTKEHRSAVGTSYLKEVMELKNLAYVAIGSVNRKTLPDILACKPSGLAICTGIISSKDPDLETEFFKKELIGAQN